MSKIATWLQSINAEININGSLTSKTNTFINANLKSGINTAAPADSPTSSMFGRSDGTVDRLPTVSEAVADLLINTMSGKNFVFESRGHEFVTPDFTEQDIEEYLGENLAN